MIKIANEESQVTGSLEDFFKEDEQTAQIITDELVNRLKDNFTQTDIV